jgi:hypothetical protein
MNCGAPEIGMRWDVCEVPCNIVKVAEEDEDGMVIAHPLWHMFNQDTVGINVGGHLDLRNTTRHRWDT